MAQKAAKEAMKNMQSGGVPNGMGPLVGGILGITVAGYLGYNAIYNGTSLRV